MGENRKDIIRNGRRTVVLGGQMNIFSILVPKQMLTYLNCQDDLDKALEFFVGSGYTAVPVVDDEGKFMGVVSEGDFLRNVIEYGVEKLAEYKVKDILRDNSNAFILNTAGKEKIMEMILDKNFIPVVDDRHCFIGIITRRSIIMQLNK